MNNINTKMIGRYLRSIRLKQGKSQAKLERITGISASTISNIETGSKGLDHQVSFITIVKIAQGLGLTLFQLLSESGFLIAIGEENYKSRKSEIYITHHELINIFNRLSLSKQQSIVTMIKEEIEKEDKACQRIIIKQGRIKKSQHL